MINRRSFLKLSAAAFGIASMPTPPSGHHVFILDNCPCVVSDIVRSGTTIRAKVVNGLWDMVLDTKAMTLSAWSNPSYGIDEKANLISTASYHQLRELVVPDYLGHVTEEMKPRTVMVGKWREEEDYVWENGEPVLNADDTPVMTGVLRPVYEKVERVYHGPNGTLTFSSWVQAQEPIVIDPLHGAGLDYNRIIEWVNREYRL